MSGTVTVVWFRRDLRLADNPAVRAAAERGPVVPVFVWEPAEEDPWAPASASRWWLHQSLTALDSSLRKVGSRLVVRRGPTLQTLLQIAREVGAGAVAWNRRHEPAVASRDERVEAGLRAEGCNAESDNASLLFGPGEVRTKQGRPFQVYTPFWNACKEARPPDRPLAAPAKLSPPAAWPESLPLACLRLEPRTDWAGGMRATWTPGEDGALRRLERFLEAPVDGYAANRDRPDLEGTSELSPHLHFGEIGPRAIWHRICERCSPDGSTGRLSKGGEVYLKELVWREFAHHLLVHFPHTADQPLRPEFAAFPWRDDPEGLRAWQRGQTGYPLVDAGMRQLWRTGWMHNRVRMVAASFLVKDLLLPWQAGARWFWDTLVDADLANNTLGWQWTAGCGADAAPFFRVFNPVAQGERFDPHGEYVRRWVPELAGLPDNFIHKPWEAPAGVLEAAGVKLGKTYPDRVVEHGPARTRALRALASLARPAK